MVTVCFTVHCFNLNKYNKVYVCVWVTLPESKAEAAILQFQFQIIADFKMTTFVIVIVNTLVTKGKTLVIKGKTLVTEGKPLVTKREVLGDQKGRPW